ncbi:hypothetical protein D1614_04130 [Maribellus luteus]|uniref:Lipocalin-like domain-containing protein n=1 Tax=Maribellus luteus TaxID=2305463 RepID=A0A399T279_9BACT|nr:hypothetical protein [Maribellus luteus]RIJ49938.1 hypothetical protein D1614_04130 [Maribellus luteus]
MKKLTILLILPLFWACQPASETKLPIEGTWLLISGETIQQNDTVFTDYTDGQKTIKIINANHFSFLRHDLNKGTDSTAVFVAGGGKYSLNGTTYTEHLEFCNFREWEDHTFDFEITINNDTLVQKGIEKIENLGVDRLIIETYTRLK